MNTSKRGSVLKILLDAVTSYSKEISLLISFFVLTVGVSNFFYNVLGFSFLPIAEYTFDQFHAFCFFLIQLLVLSWTVPALE